jgi:hypothetical protein
LTEITARFRFMFLIPRFMVVIRMKIPIAYTIFDEGKNDYGTRDLVFQKEHRLVLWLASARDSE